MPPASTRSSKSVIGSTIAAALLTLILFGVLNASFVVIKFGFEVDDHGDLHYDDNGLLGAYTTSIQFTILERPFDVRSDVHFTYLFCRLL